MIKENKPIVALLTDFGCRDGYVAAMKAVILKEHRDVLFVDISHEIPHFSIESGAYILKSVFDFFPEYTIFVVVIDPGVGTSRKGVIISADNKYLIGPDNGIFSWIASDYSHNAYTLENPKLFSRTISPTFHGRDIFAHAAVHIINGVKLTSFGPETNLTIADWINPELSHNGYLARVIHVDNFGNIVTNIQKNYLSESFSHIIIRGQKLPLVNTYGNVRAGSLCALWGSSDHLEISVNQGSAADVLNISIGDNLVIKFA